MLPMGFQAMVKETCSRLELYQLLKSGFTPKVIFCLLQTTPLIHCEGFYHSAVSFSYFGLDCCTGHAQRGIFTSFPLLLPTFAL